jgi:hypothetical protein
VRRLLLLVPLAILCACGGDDAPRPNRPPAVALTAGPMDGELASWRARFHWHGTDLDGYVARYQVAVDVPEELLDRVNDPGDTGIAWRETTELEGVFEFTTPDPGPPVDPGGVPDRHFGDHNVFVRAVDDEGAVSAADGVEFTAFNLVPRTRITVPAHVAGRDVLTTGDSIHVQWEVEDSDDESPSPLQFEMKLKQMPLGWYPFDFDMQVAVDFWAADVPWIPLGFLAPDTSALRLRLQRPHAYIFALRAIDRAGAVERLFVNGRNGLLIQSQDQIGITRLTVREPLLGKVTFPGASTSFETYRGAIHRFEMESNVWDEYGGPLVTYDYGVNVDPDDETDPGWRGWSLDRRTAPIAFETLGIHSVSFRARDNGGAVVTGTVTLRVSPATFDRGVLYVDDLRRPLSQGISDAATDARIREMIAAAGIDVTDPTEYREFHAWGEADMASQPEPLRLADLLPHRMILWDTWSTAQSRNSLLVASNACATNRVLQAYVAAGGGLWVWGQQTFGGFDLAPGSTCFANLAYVLGEAGALSFGPGDFLYEFMGLAGGGFANVRSNLDVHGLVRLEPTAAARADGLLTPIGIDRAFYPGTTPISFGDVMMDPVFNASGGLDSLFTYGAAQAASAVHRRPNAFRYADPDPVPDQGPVAVFGFPLHVFEQGSAAEKTGTFGVAATMIDWLKRHHDRFVATRGASPAMAGGR